VQAISPGARAKIEAAGGTVELVTLSGQPMPVVEPPAPKPERAPVAKAEKAPEAKAEKAPKVKAEKAPKVKPEKAPKAEAEPAPEAETAPESVQDAETGDDETKE
jgi:hypothetical protein